MKKLLLPLVLIFLGTTLSAQSADDYIEIVRSALKTEKKAAIAEVMNLTPKQSEVFWPLYNEYTAEAYKIGSKEVKIIKDFANNYESMTDEKADQIWTDYLKYSQEMLNLNKKYYKKFKKVLPAGLVAKFFQAENKIAAIVDFQMADQIPFIETK